MKKHFLLLSLSLILLLSVTAFAESQDAVFVSYLGPEGTYTEEAAQFWFQNGEVFIPKATVNDAIEDMLNGAADFAVIPQENTVGGAVVNYVDALIKAGDAYVVGEVVLPISQTLMGIPGTKLEDIRTVVSHAQGLTQSAQWRAEYLPDAAAEEMSSTAAAASYVAEQQDRSIAAVAAPGAAGLYGLEVLAENVQITDANKTRFYVLSGNEQKDESLSRAVFVADCEANQIDDIIMTIHNAGFEFVTVHDRPEGSKLGRYHYVIEVEDETGISDEQINTVASIEDVRFAGRFSSIEKDLKNSEAYSPELVSEYWTDGSKAAAAINDYLAAITDETSADYIPVKDRIAVFDLDGTLMSETYPFCFEYMVFADYALNSGSETVTDEVRAVAQEIMDAAGGEKPSGMSTRQAAAAAIAYRGMTMSQLAEMVDKFKNSDAWGFSGMTRGEAFYKPMVELFEALLANDFTVYIVTATERNIVREVVKGTLDILPSHIIGTEYGYTATGQQDTADADYTFRESDQIVFDGNYYGENAKTSKVDAIVREVGQQPVLAFGNSSGDLAMEIYTISNNPYRSAAFMVMADDEVREYGNAESAQEKKASYEDQGIQIISMHDDFATIYGAGVTKAETSGDSAISALSREGYTLEQTVVLSRHNIRSPLSGGDSLLGTITPHEWFKWSSNPSELSLRGGVLETEMGQFFRKWLEKEGLIPENYQPDNTSIRIYANSKQRTIATSRYFTAGLLPSANFKIEYHMDFDKMDPVFEPKLNFISDSYKEYAEAQIRAMFTDKITELADNYALLADVINMEDSKAWHDGTVSNFSVDDTVYIFEKDAEPKMNGSLKTACSVSDALVLQYYEESDEKKAAFGHDLTLKQWEELSEIKDVYGDVLFTAPLISVNVAHPLLQEIRSEMTAEGRIFTFLCGHDSNLGSVLAALDAAEYSLPDAIEKKTPIGSKLVLSKWIDPDGAVFWSLDLVYQKPEQLRNMPLLSEENPPIVFHVTLNGLEQNPDGLYSESDLMNRFDDAIEAYDHLIEDFTEPEKVEYESAEIIAESK